MRFKTVSALIAAAAMCAAALAAAQTPQTAARKATLVIFDRSPLKVRGLHFRRRERVRVRVTAAGESTAKRVRATRRGTFTVSFADVTIGHCTPFRIRAIGNRGTRAGVARSFIPDCFQP